VSAAGSGPGGRFAVRCGPSASIAVDGNKTKVKVTFQSGKTKWGWIHQYQGGYFLTRGNRVGFSLDTATKVEEIK
jgi:hypothetical protein